MGRANALKPGRRKDGDLPLARSELPIDMVSLACYLIGKILVRETVEGPGQRPYCRNRSVSCGEIVKLSDLARGPGRPTTAWRVDSWFDGLDLCREGPLWLGRCDHEPGEIGQSMRIGITRDANRLLRFYLRGSPFVSGPSSRSNSASAAKMPEIKRPFAVVVSRGWRPARPALSTPRHAGQVANRS